MYFKIILLIVLISIINISNLLSYNCASWGDVHNLMWNGISYDNYASGEWYMVKSDPFQVITRTYKHNCRITDTKCLAEESTIPSYNIATSIKFKDTILSVYATQGCKITHNNKVISLNNKWKNLGDSVSAFRSGNVIYWRGPEEVNVVVACNPGWNLDVTVKIPKPLSYTVMGQCGMYKKGDKVVGQLADPDGQLHKFDITRTHSGKKAYKFINSWMVMEEDSFMEKAIGSVWNNYVAQSALHKSHKYVKRKTLPWKSPEIKKLAQEACGKIPNPLFKNSCLFDAKSGKMSVKQIKKEAKESKKLFKLAGLKSNKPNKLQPIIDMLDNILNAMYQQKKKSVDEFTKVKTTLEKLVKKKKEITENHEIGIKKISSLINKIKELEKNSLKKSKFHHKSVEEELKMIRRMKILLLHLLGKKIGTRKFPASSCNMIYSLIKMGAKYKSGVYWIRKKKISKKKIQVFCKFDKKKSSTRHGWTMVWSNLKGTIGKPTTNLKWVDAINTEPIFGKNLISKNKENFEIFFGLKHWKFISPASKFRYDFSPDYGKKITNSIICDYSLTTDKMILNLRNCVLRKGKELPGIYTYHNNLPFSTIDKTNSKKICSKYYSGSPFWYDNCFSGSISGYGEADKHSGSFWNGSTKKNEGNGWFYIR